MAGRCWWEPEVFLCIEEEMVLSYGDESPLSQGMLLGGFCKAQKLTEKPSLSSEAEPSLITASHIAGVMRYTCLPPCPLGCVQVQNA